MSNTDWVLPVVALLLLGRWGMQLGLGLLNCRHVRAHAHAVPAAFRDFIDSATYAKSVDYTLAKSRFTQVEQAYATLLMAGVLFTGVLPAAYGAYTALCGSSALAAAGFLWFASMFFSFAVLPFDWYAQFSLEERFGFNTTTPALWWMDRLKGMLLSLLLGYPLLVLVLKIFEWTGAGWWLWAWGSLLGFQALMMVLAPVLILPLFNKFTPLPEGSLRDRLLALARRTGFQAQSIQVMDGSRRSRHANAFFTGFGRFRKIVLFDTLLNQLEENELEAVLAHEIGHYRLKHIPLMLAGSAVISLLGFYLLSVLVAQSWFYQAFGFTPGQIAPALLLFGLLAGTVSFWLAPLGNLLSRRFEYQADAFAAQAVGQGQPLIGALRKLNEKNLSNLTPHPLYSGFYYSHPTLLERERALQAVPNELVAANS